MCLLNLKIDEMAVIDKVNANEALRQRLVAMGITTDAQISIRHFGWFKSTVQVAINRSLIGMRKEEAAQIEVRKI